MYCTGGTECLSCTPGSHSVCAVRTPLGVDWKILSVKMLLAFRVRKTTQHGFFPDRENFPLTGKFSLDRKILSVKMLLEFRVR